VKQTLVVVVLAALAAAGLVGAGVGAGAEASATSSARACARRGTSRSRRRRASRSPPEIRVSRSWRTGRGKISEDYMRWIDGKQLYVIVNFDGGRGRSITFRRIYDPAE